MRVRVNASVEHGVAVPTGGGLLGADKEIARGIKENEDLKRLNVGNSPLSQANVDLEIIELAKELAKLEKMCKERETRDRNIEEQLQTTETELALLTDQNVTQR